ncbi:hypothetical protein [Pseudomonas gingeri]|uniref:hypothetical protein n=1 Tax=Pseudomonas gingeri TaxID=117681 RepID=UPI0015A1B468|nr:hypothetical protein [Pseudomonas gingeri]NWA01433.1 hypothetical protein [Pseudomonas gingeri]NWA13764.1 hypothetical protein [Pseudomonas gingeri]NWA52876.1 hypothetical protein [Pseudomonas gingeri]NWA96373.1 hypothetical protein [Pseudomonas gingeri]NWA99990.1 hypothetical protein [Pseudomonas gingeri]
MLSTLTTGVKDGKPVRKIERNTWKIDLYEILFCASGGKSRTIAHYFGAAQSFLAVLLVADADLRGEYAPCGSRLAGDGPRKIDARRKGLIAGKPAPTKSWRR